MEKFPTPPRLSVSSWSLHGALGQPHNYGPDNGTTIPVHTHNQGELSLLELPARLEGFGVNTMELSHFHLPSREIAYLDEFRAALKEARVELFSLLIDEGDITHPVHGERDYKWIEGWVEVAAELGADRMRVIAGQAQPTQEAFEMSAKRLYLLAHAADMEGVRLTTENWYDLLGKPEHVWSLLYALDGKVGLNLDFGNWEGETKYSDLAEIAHMAESCHAKGDFSSGQLDTEDYNRCLDILHEAEFSGPFTLVYEETEDEWQGLEIQKNIIAPYVNARA